MGLQERPNFRERRRATARVARNAREKMAVAAQLSWHSGHRHAPPTCCLACRVRSARGVVGVIRTGYRWLELVGRTPTTNSNHRKRHSRRHFPRGWLELELDLGA